MNAPSRCSPGSSDWSPPNSWPAPSYPDAKVDRLPLVAARYTEVEFQLALLDRDMRWLESAPRAVAERVVSQWRLASDRARGARTFDRAQKELVRTALTSLAAR
ncbi:MAG: hypothetical protein V9E94_08635 [Microthrixaceae bacterium]